MVYDFICRKPSFPSRFCIKYGDGQAEKVGAGRSTKYLKKEG
jgi:hypothetical protein